MLFADNANEHVIQSFEIFSMVAKYISVCSSVVKRLQIEKIDAFFRNLDLHSNRRK